MIRITGMDHIVLKVADVERSLAFYVDTLGLAPDRVELWRSGAIRFPSARLNEGTIIDLVHVDEPTPAGRGNLDHFCMVVDADRIEDIAADLQAAGVAIEEGPIKRAGARGDAMSVYVRDPDGNKVELRTYVPLLAAAQREPAGAASA
jgi:catechol 2,3-dioxygenase-like lactoylglutathione lyase family enzyme